MLKTSTSVSIRVPKEVTARFRPNSGAHTPPSRKWLLLLSMAFVGAIGGVLLAPRLIRRQATPDRLQSKEVEVLTNRENTWKNNGLYETPSVRVVFNMDVETVDLDEEEGGGASPTWDGSGTVDPTGTVQ